MSHYPEYPLPTLYDPLKGITDAKMVEYWIKNDLLCRQLEYMRYDANGEALCYYLYQHAETVDILFLVFFNMINLHNDPIAFTPEVCKKITFDQIIQLHQQHRWELNFTSFNYTLPNGDICYRIVELLDSIKEDEIDIYIEKYSKIYPNIFILLSTLPYKKCRQIAQDIIQSDIKFELSKDDYQVYLLCTTVFDTYNVELYHKKTTGKKGIFNQYERVPMFDWVLAYSPSEIQYQIQNGCFRFQNDDDDDDGKFNQYETKGRGTFLNRYINILPNPRCLDMITDSRFYEKNLLKLLYSYIRIDDIFMVNSILEYMATTTSTTRPHISVVRNDILYYATSANMVHLLVSYNAPVVGIMEPYPPCNAHRQDVLTRRSIDVVKALLCHKANLSYDDDGKHTLHKISTSHVDVVKFLIPFLSSSTSDIAINVKNNNTTGLPDDIYNYIKTSLSKIDINISDPDGFTPLCYSLTELTQHFLYLLENDASPHIYTRFDIKHGYKVFNTFDNALLAMENTPDNAEPYHHYLDFNLLTHTTIPGLWYHATYNLMKYKAYPLTYIQDKANYKCFNTPNQTFFYSYLQAAIECKQIEFVRLLLDYLTPVNMILMPPDTDTGDDAMYPLEFALFWNISRPDITYELIQYGAIYHPTDKIYDKGERINNLILDQCFQRKL